jgi:hypothetical protein
MGAPKLLIRAWLWRSRTIVGQMGLDSLVSVSGGVDFILRILARLGWGSIRPERTPRVFGQLVGTLGPRRRLSTLRLPGGPKGHRPVDIGSSTPHSGIRRL